MKSIPQNKWYTTTPLFVASFLLFMTVSSSTLSSNTLFAPGLQKGACFAAWEKERLRTPHSDDSLKKLSELGANHVQIVTTYFQKTYISTEIKPTDLTPSNKSIIHAINKAHELGLKVMLKPHVDLIDDENGNFCRADIGGYSEEGWEKWFTSYRSYILKYAKLAEEHGVETFCVGTELSFASEQEAFWRSLIHEVRTIYSGEVIYAANWDNYNNIRFWDSLDSVGIDAYFPLAENNSPSLSEIKSGWEKWKNELEAFHKNNGKPVIFTEIGYPSAAHAPLEPWKNGYTGNADTDMQADCYKAFFESVWGSPWLKGVYWWRWNPSVYSGGKNNRYYTPQNKPAEEILKTHFNPTQE